MLRVVVESEGVKNARSLVAAAMENEAKILKIGIEKTKRNLEALEGKYKMTTDSFYKRFSKGELGDDIEFIRWAGEFETLVKIERDYKEIEEAEIC